jgi:heat shock protein HslJ
LRVPSRALALAAVLAATGCAMPTHPDSAAAPSNPLNPAAVQSIRSREPIAAREAAREALSCRAVELERGSGGCARRNVEGIVAVAFLHAAQHPARVVEQLHSGVLTLGPLEATRKACGDEARHLERVYLDALAHADATLVQMRSPQQMRIIASNGITLTFSRAGQ